MTKTNGNPKLAGFVLAIFGLPTMGATSPFALVLCDEWSSDPTRVGWKRNLDWVGLVFAVPGSAFFLWLSVGLFNYAPGGVSFTVVPHHLHHFNAAKVIGCGQCSTQE